MVGGNKVGTGAIGDLEGPAAAHMAPQYSRRALASATLMITHARATQTKRAAVILIVFLGAEHTVGVCSGLRPRELHLRYAGGTITAAARSTV